VPLTTEETVELTEREIIAAHHLGEALLRFVAAIEAGVKTRAAIPQDQTSPAAPVERVVAPPTPARHSMVVEAPASDAQKPKPEKRTTEKPASNPRLVNEQSLITVPEAAELLSLSRSKVYLLMDGGTLPYIRIGRTRRVRLNDLRKLITDNLVSRS
jgi:excisionase family DNA binding protein